LPKSETRMTDETKPETTPEVPEAAAKPVATPSATPLPPEVGGRGGPDPVRYGDWEKGGIAVDF
jgi:hypothetical protein